MPRQRGAWHLVRRTADVERRATQVPTVERAQQGGVVDQVAARCIDEVRTPLHAGKRFVFQQVFGRCIGSCQADHEVGLRQEFRQADLHDSGCANLHLRIAHHHTHAQGLCQRAQVTADLPVPDHTQGRAAQFAAHPGLCVHASAVTGGCAGDMPTQVDHHADDPLRDRCHEARAGLCHQHAMRTRRSDVDGADVHGATHHCLQVGKRSKHAGVQRGLPIRNDRAAAECSVYQ